MAAISKSISDKVDERNENILPQRDLNQKEFIKEEIRKYLEVLDKKGLHDKVLNCNALRDSIIPQCKKKIQLSYSIGPKLMYEWLDEVSQTNFNGKFKFHYASNSYRNRGSKTASDKSEQYEKLHHVYTNLLRSYTMINDRATKERENYTKQISSLINTVNMLTKENSELRATIDEIKGDSSALNPRKRKRTDSIIQNLNSSASLLNVECTTPHLKNLSPSFGYTDEQLLCHVEVKNFNQNSKWVAVVTNMTTHEARTEKLNSKKLKQGMVAINLGKFNSPTDLMIHFRTEDHNQCTEPLSFSVLPLKDDTNFDYLNLGDSEMIDSMLSNQVF